MPHEKDIRELREEHALHEALRVADTLCLKYPRQEKEECRDAAQDALLKWCDYLDHDLIEEPDHPYSWLYKTALRELIDARKHGSHLTGLDAMETEPSHEPEANTWENGRDFEKLLFLAGLDHSDRALVRVRVLLDKKWEDISDCRTDDR